jgi:hypothetical protein
VTYNADIELKGIAWLFTPFIKSGLRDLTKHAE